MRKLLSNWPLYLPIVAALLFIGGLMGTVLYQSRHASISASDQKLAGQEVTIERVFLRTDGFAAIHRSDAKGNLVEEASIGHIPLAAGLNFEVTVPLTEAVTSGSKLFAVVHRDTGSVGRYEFGKPGGKDPIALAEGEPVAAPFAVE